MCARGWQITTPSKRIYCVLITILMSGALYIKGEYKDLDMH